MSVSGYEKRLVFLLLITALIVRLIFVVAVPAWQSPDEFPHYWVMNDIKTNHSLPVSNPDFPYYEAYQPPLYYVVGAAVCSLFDEPPAFTEEPLSPSSQLVAIRLISVLLGMFFLYISYRIFLNIPSLNAASRLLGLSFLCFLPTLVGIQSSVNNDAPVILTSSLSLYVLTRKKDESKNTLLAFFWAGVSMLIKVSAVFLPVVIILYVFLIGSEKKKIRTIITGLAVFTGIASLLGIRNLIQYGDWFGLNPGYVTGWSFSVNHLMWSLRNLSWSFIFGFGRLYQVQLAPFLYIVVFLLISVPVLSGWFRNYRSENQWFFFLTAGILAAISASLTYTFIYPAGTMTSWGKNLYPILPFIAVFTAIGFNSFARIRKFTEIRSTDTANEKITNRNVMIILAGNTLLFTGLLGYALYTFLNMTI